MEVKLPILQGIEGPHHNVDLTILADMLKSLAGRDLLLVMGSEAADTPNLEAVWHAARTLMLPLMSRWSHEERGRIGGLPKAVTCCHHAHAPTANGCMSALTIEPS